VYFIGIFSGNKLFTRVQKGNRFWTFLKMSILEKSKDFMKKGLQNSVSEHNALIFKKQRIYL
jgi:hypothetical protein